MKDESRHFTPFRVTNQFLNLIMLFVTSMMLGNKYSKERIVSLETGYMALGLFVIFAIVLTLFNAKQIRKTHEIKRRAGYHFDP